MQLLKQMALVNQINVKCVDTADKSVKGISAGVTSWGVLV
jgi:hypothetical protein